MRRTDMKHAIVSGTSINRSLVFEGWTERRVSTDYGEVAVKESGDVVALNRHGFERPMPPHAINYRANVAALAMLGVGSAVTLNSVGSLDATLAPGTLVCFDDYMSFAPKTFIDDRMSAFAPRIGNLLLEEIERVAPMAIAKGKIYAQTPGPRFETRAEVRALRQAWGADVVGMTFANEADLLLEKGIEITAFGMIDNFAHGVAGAVLSEAAFLDLVLKNQQTVDGFLGAVARLLGEAGQG